MFHLILKYAISAALIVAISELGKRSAWLGAALAAIPLTSILAFIWLHAEGASNSAVAQMSMQIVWLVLASLPLFLTFALLLQRGLSFWPSLLFSVSVTSILYLLVVWWLKPI
jgi:hypothetical protein